MKVATHVLFKLASVALLSFFWHTAHAGSCPQNGSASCSSGYLCFYDQDTNYTCGKVFGTNRNWGDFGWNDRADYFYNGGASYGVCLYDRANFNAGRFGRFYRKSFVDLGDYRTFSNAVSSNRWTNDSSCPRG